MPDQKESENVPVTHVRIQIPRGTKISDVLERLEISFEEVEPAKPLEFKPDVSCCVDVAVVSPVSTISNR